MNTLTFLRSEFEKYVKLRDEAKRDGYIYFIYKNNINHLDRADKIIASLNKHFKDLTCQYATIDLIF